MTTADLVNRIVAKLGGNRVRFTLIAEDRVQFEHAQNLYWVRNNLDVYRWSDDDNQFLIDSYSEWIEGVLNGKTRDDAGVLS